MTLPEMVARLLTNPDRVLFPDCGFTKADLAAYYVAIAPQLLPHLEGRPITLRRFPDGIEGEGFWEKRCPEHRPDWVETAEIESESSGKSIRFCVASDQRTLAWLANLATIEIHPYLFRHEAPGRPTAMVFDLDPGAPAGLTECARVALDLRHTFERLSLESFPKLSGGKGMQIYVPVDPDRHTINQTKTFAHALAKVFEQAFPDRVVSRMTKSLRKGKVLIDWSQNDPHKTTVSVYSVRARPEPRVSAPLTWEEVETATSGEGVGHRGFTPVQMLERAADLGDLFSGTLELRQKLPEFGAEEGLEGAL